MTITMQVMLAITSPMYAPIASVQNPKNRPKILGFRTGHLQYVGNPKNTILGGVSVTRVGGAYKNTIDNSPFKHSIVSKDPNFRLNEFASKFD